MSAPATKPMALSPELAAALDYGAAVVVVGPDPDAPGDFRTDFFRITPVGPRREVPAAEVVAGLRGIADLIEQNGAPL